MSNPHEDLMYRAGLTAQGCWDQMDEYNKTAVATYGQLVAEECIRLVEMWEKDSRNHISYMLENYFEEKQ